MFEPLVGELFRSGFVMQVAALHGDFVTPTIMGAGESDAAREQRGARALFRMLADDEAHGAAEQDDHAGLAGRVRAGEPSRRPGTCSRSGRSSPRRSSASRTPSSARAERLETCSTRSASRPRRRSRHDRVRPPIARSSNMAGVTLMNNQVGYVVADVMRGKEGVIVTELPSMIRVDGVEQGRLRLRGDRRGPRVGRLRQRRLRGDHVAPTTGVWSSSTTGCCCSPTRRTPPSTSASTSSRCVAEARRGESMYEKDGEKYFVFDSHLHFWDASPENWVQGRRGVREGLDRVLPRVPGPRPG